MRAIVALCFAAALSLLAPRAQAYLLPDGSVVWTFEGHGGPFGGAMDQPVSGSLRFMYGDVTRGTALLDLTVGGVPHAASGGTFEDDLFVGDGNGAPGSTDYVTVGSTYSYLSAPSILFPRSVNWGDGFWQLILRDTDSMAWTGLSGPLPPVNPPDATAFETRDIQLLQQSCQDYGNGYCTGAYSSVEPVFEVTIDAFTVPEPGTLAPCGLGLAALVAARRKLRTLQLLA